MQRALLLAFALASTTAAPATITTAHFYSGLSCRGQMVFSADAALTNDGRWSFGSCWGFTSAKARSVYFVATKKCIGALPIHRFWCDSYGWAQGR